MGKHHGYEQVGDISVTTAEERFERMYAAHESVILAYCLRRVDRDAALDCAAETFLTAWRRIEDVPDGDATLKWLYRTAHNVIGNHYRRRNRRRSHLVPLDRVTPRDVTDDGPETVIVRREADREVIDALARLSDSDRQVLLLSAWEGLSHASIGEIVGCSAHAVDQRIHRAVRRLGNQLAAPGSQGRRPPHEPASGEVNDVDPR